MKPKKKQEKRFNFFYNGVAITRNHFIRSVPADWEKDVNEYGEYSYGYYRAIKI